MSTPSQVESIFFAAMDKRTAAERAGYDTSGLSIGDSPYTITYAYSTDGTFASASTTSTLSITKAMPTITATSNGDASFPAVQSEAIAESITRAGTQIVLIPQPVFNMKKKVTSIGLKAEIEPLAPGGGVPTGSVTFELVTKARKPAKATRLGIVALSGGDATLTRKASKLLNKAITIVYGGDTDFQSSAATLPVLTQSELKGLARPMIALIHPTRPHAHSLR